MAAIKRCRTESSLKMQVQCTECPHQHLVPHSCGHRYCPNCQNHESQQWLERQLKKQVPAEYFLLTFTVPFEFRALAFAHQRVVFDLMLRCTWATVRTFSQNDRQLQGAPGGIAVLHTNSRRLDFHPHVHLVMPAAAIAVDGKGKRWRTKRPGKGKKGYLLGGGLTLLLVAGLVQQRVQIVASHDLTLVVVPIPGATSCFAVNRDYTRHDPDEASDPFTKTGLEHLGVEQAKHPAKGVVRWRAVFKNQIAFEPRFVILSPFGNIYPSVRSAQHRA